MRETLHPLLRGALLVLVALVASFHLWILGARVADGSVLEPGPAGRWLAAAALVAVLGVLRRRGVSLVRGRSALVVWLLVALLHGVGSAGPTATAVGERALPPAELLWLASPLGLAVTALFWAGAVAARRRGGRARLVCGRLPGGERAAAAARGPLLAAAGPRAPPV